jgi:hypothetical protein
MISLDPLRFIDWNVLNVTMVPLTIPSLGDRFVMIMTFIPLYNFKKGVKFWILLVETICLMGYCMSICIKLFL